MKFYIDTINDKAYISMKEALAHCPKHRIQEVSGSFRPNDGDTIYYSTYKYSAFCNQKEFDEKYPYEYPYEATIVMCSTDLTGQEFDVEIEQNEKGFYTVIYPNNNNRGKMFFLDKDYSGPCLAGNARVKIVKDFTSYGFFTILELESYQMQDDTWFANYLADKFLESDNMEIYRDIFRYEGVRGACYLRKNPLCDKIYHYDAEEEGKSRTFSGQKLDTVPVRLCSVVGFVSRVCYKRNDLWDIISEMKPSVAEKYAHSITWDLAMNSLDQMLYESSSEDVDLEFALETLFDARVIVPVRVEKAVAFKILKDRFITNNFYKNLFQLKKVELDAAIEFINEVNKIADERVAALIKARKIKV